MTSHRRPKAVLFDLDGVLIDSYYAWFHLLNAAREHFDYSPINQKAFHEIWGQAASKDKERFFERQTVEELEQYYSRHFRDFMEHVDVRAGVEEVFDLLESRGIGTAVVTNTAQPLANDLVQHAKARPNTVVGGNEVSQAKPAPDMLFKALDELKVEPADAWMVGDSVFDQKAAEAAEVRFIGVEISGWQVIESPSGLIPLIDDAANTDV